MVINWGSGDINYCQIVDSVWVEELYQINSALSQYSWVDIYVHDFKKAEWISNVITHSNGNFAVIQWKVDEIIGDKLKELIEWSVEGEKNEKSYHKTRNLWELRTLSCWGKLYKQGNNKRGCWR